MPAPVQARSIALDRRRYHRDSTSRPENRSSQRAVPISAQRRPEPKRHFPVYAKSVRCELHSLPQCPACLTLPSSTDRPTSSPVVANHGRRRTHKPEQPATSLTRRAPGGLRTNCFNVYPHQGGHDVDFAVDYMIEYFAPLIFGSYPKFGNPLVAVAFPYALENADLFLAMLTLAQAHVDSIRPEGKPSLESLMFWGSTVSKLQTKMKDPETCADDAAILANIYMMGAASRFAWQDAVNTFYLGMKRMVSIRGGLDNLGLDGYVKNCILYQDALGMHSVSEDSDQLVFEGITPSSEKGTSTAASSPQSATSSPLQYPSHPFSPGMCESLAKLPPGLVDLAMHGYMCTDLISIAERIYHFASQKQLILLEHGPGEHISELEKVARRLSVSAERSAKRRMERLLCLGFTMLCLEVFTTMTSSLINKPRWRLIKKLCLSHEELEEPCTPAETRLELELKAWFLILASKSSSEEGDFRIEGQRVEMVLFDYLLDPPSSSKVFAKPDFVFARRWRGKHGLRVVLARFYIDDNLEAEWHAAWKRHMQRKKYAVPQQDLEGPKRELMRHDSQEEEIARARLLQYITKRSWHNAEGLSNNSSDASSDRSARQISSMTSNGWGSGQHDNSSDLRIELSLEDC